MNPATFERIRMQQLEAPSAVERIAVMLSIVICTRDRPESLLRCVRSVARQTVRPSELIVVDDGQLSPEHRESLASICCTADIRLILLQKAVPGLPASRNLAVRHAEGDIVQFLDDDVELEPDFCRYILRIYELDAQCAVVGTEGVLLDAVPSLAARAFGIVYRLAGWWALRPKNSSRQKLPAALQDRRWAISTHVVSGACMAFRRSALLHHPFDEGLAGYALGEDRDVSLRVACDGRLLHVRGANAIHRHDPAGRPDYFAFGRMTVVNYVRIMRRIGRTSLGDRIVIAYTLTVIGLALAFCTLLKPRRYGPELMGLLAGAADAVRCAIASARWESPPHAVQAWVEGRTVWIQLVDERVIGVPADKFPRLRAASDEDLALVRVEARGKALRWEELDEDISVAGIVAGRFG